MMLGMLGMQPPARFHFFLGKEARQPDLSAQKVPQPQRVPFFYELVDGGVHLCYQLVTRQTDSRDPVSEF